MRRVPHAALPLVVLAIGCKPAATPTPTPPAAEAQPAPKAALAFDPAAVSDAPLDAEECAQFGQLRAADPQETGTALEYAADCLMFTADEEPWMRRVTRCYVVAPDDGSRARCLDAMPPSEGPREP